MSKKDNLLRAIRHEGPEHVPYAGEGAYRLVDHIGRKPPRTGQDAWGVTWAPLPADYAAGADEPAESYAETPPARTAAGALALPVPPRGDDPALFVGLLEGLDPAQTLVIGQHGAGLLDRFCTLVGMDRAMLALIAEPVACAALFERIADHHVAAARGYLAAGAEAGWLADDYAGNTGPYLSPAMWRRLFLPQLARVIAVYREAGAPVFFHTCGRAEAFIGPLLDVGVSVFNLQTDACDLALLRAHYGRRLTIFGGVASDVMLRGTPEQVRRAARAAIDQAGPEGGLILAPDQPLAFPPENEGALVEAAREFGKHR